MYVWMVALQPPPLPMLARPGALPTRGAWAFEVKWEGFRCVVSTEDGFTARGRRGWRMTDRPQSLVRAVALQ